METSYLDLISFGTSVSALIGYLIYDISKGGVKWYVSLTKAINIFMSDKR
jgi:hypothetical protein